MSTVQSVPFGMGPLNQPKQALPASDQAFLAEVMDYKGRAVVLKSIEQSQKDEAKFPKGAASRETLRKSRHEVQKNDGDRVMVLLKAKVLEQRNEITGSREAHVAMQRDVTVFKKRAEEAEAKVEGYELLERDNDSLQDSLTGAQNESASLRAELKKVNAEKSEAEQEAAGLRAARQGKDKLVEQLRAKVQDGEGLVKDITKERDKLSARIERLVTESKRQSDELSALHNDLKDVQAHDKTTCIELNLATGQNSQLTLQNDKLRKEMDELRAQNAKLVQDLSQSQAAFVLQELDNQSLKAEMAGLRDKIAKAADVLLK